MVNRGRCAVGGPDHRAIYEAFNAAAEIYDDAVELYKMHNKLPSA